MDIYIVDSMQIKKKFFHLILLSSSRLKYKFSVPVNGTLCRVVEHFSLLYCKICTNNQEKIIALFRAVMRPGKCP